MVKEKEFLDLIGQHQGILYKLARMYATDEESRKDLVQEMLYQLWRSYGSFKNKSRFSTWLYRVAVNTAITSLKKEKNRPQNLALNEHVYEEKPTDTSSRLELFYAAVQQLSKIEKAVIFYHLENLSHRDIGKNLGISEGNARVRLSRAKIKLKHILAQFQKNQSYEF